MAIRKPGVYAPLSANYADDEAIMEAGEDAELMYIRMLAYAARTPLTEGRISHRVAISRLGILPRVAGNGAGNEPGTDAGSRLETLREVGLITGEGDGWQITSWLKWNKSAEEMGREKARDSSRKKAATSTNDGNGAGTDAGNGAGVPPLIPLSDQNTDQNTETTLPIADAKGVDDSLDDWWETWPRKVAKGRARVAYKAALKKTDAKTLKETSVAQARHLMRNGIDKCPYPASWLNGECWNDTEHLSGSRASNSTRYPSIAEVKAREAAQEAADIAADAAREANK